VGVAHLGVAVTEGPHRELHGNVRLAQGSVRSAETAGKIEITPARKEVGRSLVADKPGQQVLSDDAMIVMQHVIALRIENLVLGGRREAIGETIDAADIGSAIPVALTAETPADQHIDGAIVKGDDRGVKLRYDQIFIVARVAEHRGGSAAQRAGTIV